MHFFLLRIFRVSLQVKVVLCFIYTYMYLNILYTYILLYYTVYIVYLNTSILQAYSFNTIKRLYYDF